MSYEYVIGVDEAGRGPLAGPVAVGAVLVPAGFNWLELSGVGDSKQVSPKKREAIFSLALALKDAKQLDYAVVLVSAQKIDLLGIVPAIREALGQALGELVARNKDFDFQTTLVQLDGGLTAPTEYRHQETIIKGDAKEKVIGLASIMAKVTRDRYMEQVAKKTGFTEYGFAVHKGYGTKKHRELIQTHGLSKEHRRSFCRNVLGQDSPDTKTAG